ncbi:MAG: CoA-binding protein [Candidatus Micrarchaeaceae archaeon]
MDWNTRRRLFDTLMSPKSVAIIGATNNPNKVGHIIMQNYIDVGYSGPIWPVNINAKKGDRILGYPAYSSILDIKKPIDLVVIAVPADSVPKVLEECGKAKAKSVVIVSGGFAEIGRVELQQKLVDIKNKYSFILMGPNCLGIMNTRSTVDTLFLPTFKIDRPRIGGVSFASQSGAVGSSILDMIDAEGFGLSKFISYGNAIDIDEVDILDYLARDDETSVVIFYMEGAKRGKEFIEALKDITMKKPVVMIKGGATEAGATAAHSHTASLAGSYQTYEAIFRQFGVTQANTMQDVMDFAKMFDSQPLPKGGRVAIITNGGGVGVIATDALYEAGLELASFSKESERALRKVMPPIVNIRMPMDMAGDADDKRFAAALEITGSDPNVDAIMVIALFQTPGADSRVAASLINYSATKQKPIAVVSPGGSYTQAHRNMMESSGVPVYSSPDQAARAFKALLEYRKYKDSKMRK